MENSAPELFNGAQLAERRFADNVHDEGEHGTEAGVCDVAEVDVVEKRGVLLFGVFVLFLEDVVRA